MADINTVRAKVQAALDEHVRVVNLAASTVKTKIEDALSEVDAVITPVEPVISSTLTFTEGVASSIDVSSLLPAGADRYHGGWDVQVDGFFTDNSVFNGLPGVYFDPATLEMVYDGSPMSLNSQNGVTLAKSPNTGYFIGAEQGPYNAHWQYPPTQVQTLPPATVGGVKTAQSIWNGSKHTRAIYCPWDQKLRVYGGDYATPGLLTQGIGQDGRMLMWKVDPTTSPTTWTLDYPAKGRVGEAVALQSDRMNMDWDPTRQIFWIAHGSPRPGPAGYIGNNVPAGFTGDPKLYWKGDGGIATAYPEGANDNNFPVFVYDPKGTTSFRLARPSTPLLTPWVQANSCMMGTAYHDASKRWYGMIKGGGTNGGVTLFWLDTTNWETSPESLEWQTLKIDLGVGDPLNLTGKSHRFIFGPANSPMFVDDLKKVMYFWDVNGQTTDLSTGKPLAAGSTNPALLAVTLPGHALGEHRVITIADLKDAIGYDIAHKFTGLTSLSLSPFAWIPEHRCIVWQNEPDEENVGPWTRNFQIDVDTGAISEGPRFPNNNEDGMPYHPNCGVWFPPTGEFISFGLSIMTHSIPNHNRSWDAVGADGAVVCPKVWNRYKWID